MQREATRTEQRTGQKRPAPQIQEARFGAARKKLETARERLGVLYKKYWVVHPDALAKDNLGGLELMEAVNEFHKAARGVFRAGRDPDLPILEDPILEDEDFREWFAARRTLGDRDELRALKNNEPELSELTADFNDPLPPADIWLLTIYDDLVNSMENKARQLDPTSPRPELWGLLPTKVIRARVKAEAAKSKPFPDWMRYVVLKSNDIPPKGSDNFSDMDRTQLEDKRLSELHADLRRKTREMSQQAFDKWIRRLGIRASRKARCKPLRKFTTKIVPEPHRSV